MVTSNPKRQKVNDDKVQIIFHSPGLQPDVRLKFFDTTEFHVHSVILKLNSAFFRKFLDSPDKEDMKNNLNGSFRYEWVTKVDEDGDWHFVSASDSVTEKEQVDSTKFDSNNQKYEGEIFEKMLCAMYLLRYQFDWVEDIIRLTSIADYYRALPAVSRTLTDALLRHESHCIDALHVKEEPFGLLEAAAKLRHESLFRDCLALAVTPWASPEYLKWKDFKFNKAAKELVQDITTKVANAHRTIIYQIGEPEPTPPIEEKLAAVQAAAREATKGVIAGMTYASYIHLPRYFYKIHCSGNDSLSSSLLNEVLQNNLVFLGRNAYSHSEVRAGDDNWGDCFFCRKLADKYLPWDRTETDW